MARPVSLFMLCSTFNVTHSFATTPLRYATQSDRQAAGENSYLFSIPKQIQVLPSGLPVRLHGLAQWCSGERVGDVGCVAPPRTSTCVIHLMFYGRHKKSIRLTATRHTLHKGSVTERFLLWGIRANTRIRIRIIRLLCHPM